MAEAEVLTVKDAESAQNAVLELIFKISEFS